MNIVNITLGVDTQPCSSITLGRRGENEVTQVVVDFSSWVEEFGAGVITLLAMRSQDTFAYPVVLTLDGNTATWDVTSTDTAFKGSGRAEYIYTVGNQIAKSVVFGTTVLQDIGEPSETPPDPYEEWLERLTELGAETQENAEAAQQSAEDAEQSAQDAAQEAANAEGYAEQAGESASAAQSAEAASESARDEAQAAQASAESSATAASGSAASAAGSATAAAGSASDASASATAAGASATAAGNAATQAEAANTAAQTAQSAAEDAAEDAQQAAQQAHVEYEQLSGEVDDLSDEVSQQKSAIDDLTALTNRKAGMLVDTASGAIASFAPDATVPNLLGVSVDIEPVQDLHGYDSPWPGGGGKNKFTTTGETSGEYLNENGVIASGSGWMLSDYIPVTPSTQYTFNPNSTEGYSAKSWYFDANKLGISAINSGQNTFTTPNNCYFMRFSYRETSTNIQLELGPTATSYAPYENICPISGWDAVEAERTGVNLLDAQAAVESSGHPNYCKIEDGYLKFLTGNSQVNGLRWSGFSFPTPLTFVMSVKNFGSSANVCRLLAYYDDGTYDQFFYAELASGQEMLQTYTIPANGKRVVRINSGWTSGIQAGINLSASQIELGSTATEYKPYAGNRYTRTYPATIYGGTDDVTGDGVTSTMAMVDLGTLDWEKHQQNNVFYCAFSGNADKNGTLGYKYLSSMWEYGSAANAIWNGSAYGLAVQPNAISSTSRIYARNPVFDALTATEFKAAMSGVQLCYELETPIEIQLDPVQIASIPNQTNDVWADAGNVTVEFAADVKTYIDNKIAAAVAALS